jgi:hypothetical protein
VRARDLARKPMEFPDADVSVSVDVSGPDDEDRVFGVPRGEVMQQWTGPGSSDHVRELVILCALEPPTRRRRRR